MHANKILHVLTQEYYQYAIQIMKQEKNKLNFFIFSDDITWCKDNLFSLKESVFIENKKSSSNYNELYMMSQCKNHIIANSSFSWWGAWLNPNNDKIIIAPKLWFKDSSYDDKDLMPESWIRI